MKKSWSFCLVLASVLMLTGCDGKFEPTESTVFVTSKGIVKSAVMESFEKDYYDFGELSADVEKAAAEYCAETTEEAVTVESLTQGEDDSVTLLMNYASVRDYADFNDVILFAGTPAEAKAAGYEPENLLDAEGNAADPTDEELSKLKVIVTEENICVQTGGKIKYVSDNVSVLDKKLAKAMEAGHTHPAFVIYK